MIDQAMVADSIVTGKMNDVACLARTLRHVAE
jgi:hypothetical protein